jgi:hypothetical protein
VFLEIPNEFTVCLLYLTECIDFITLIVIYSKIEKGKTFVHADCVNAIQVNESGLTLECCIWFCSIPPSKVNL